ncbi:MAG: metallophosphoesterase [Cyanobacteria bacterium J06642_2]
MPPRWSRALAGICALAVCLMGLAACSIDPALTVALPSPTPSPIVADPPRFLTDPFLQFPTANSVRVVWFSEFDGRDPVVIVGRPGERDINPGTQQRTAATSSILSRTREDRDSHANGQKPPRSILSPRPQRRPIWRYEATVTGLAPGERVPYRVEMVSERGESLASDTFTLAPTPPPAQPLKILLTSDHQLKPMTAANLQKVAETVGRVDAVFMAGDLVNVPDRASEWFDDDRGGAFFPCLQGRARYLLKGGGIPAKTYKGGELIQHAPLFPAIGNHEVMGRFDPERRLNEQFNDSVPREIAQRQYEFYRQQVNPQGYPAIAREWIEDQSFNSKTYEEIFSLPTNPAGHGRYYATTFGDIRLVVLDAAAMWRSPNLSDLTKGRFRERQSDFPYPDRWGYGQHIFEPIARGSEQFAWLERELASSEFQQARYKIVMLHHPLHSLGDNIVPPFTNPVPTVTRNIDGTISSIRYDYPPVNDYLIRDVAPLLEAAGVDLVYYGHSHLWNRFVSAAGTNYLESSNVGNTYGAYLSTSQREIPRDRTGVYAALGDPNGLTPIVPTVRPQRGKGGVKLPYVASNTTAVFSIFDSETGVVSSYYFNTKAPKSKVIEFDRFSLNR